MNNDELLTTSEAVQLLRVSRTTFYKFLREGVITPRGAGKTNFFLKSEILDALLNTKTRLAS